MAMNFSYTGKKVKPLITKQVQQTGTTLGLQKQHTLTMFSLISRRACLQPGRQFSSLTKPTSTSNILYPSLNNAQPVIPSNFGIFGTVMGLIQKRFKTRGNTYQPSTLKRKRTFGFLARLKTRGGKKVLERRREKGRWYMSH